MAERGLRHLAVQRKISTHFDNGLEGYLLFLGIMQTCRFQNKSFLKFLLSGKKGIKVNQKHCNFVLEQGQLEARSKFGMSLGWRGVQARDKRFFGEISLRAKRLGCAFERLDVFLGGWIDSTFREMESL